MTYRIGLLILGAFLTGIYVLFAIATRPPEAPEHQIFINGHILTLDGNNTVADALSVRGDRIDAVGNAESLLADATDATLVTDLRGRTLMPGIVDAHGHFPGSGQVVFSANLNSPPMGTVESMPQLIDALKEYAQQRPDGWIRGFGYDDTLLAEGRHPTRYDLDQVSTERPVAVVHTSGHLAAVNSVALAEMDITAATADPKGGHIQRFGQGEAGEPGEPNGVLEETAARVVLMKTLNIGAMDAIRMTTHAAREYLEQGVTTASAGGMPAMIADLLGPLSRFNVYPQRVVLFPLMEEVEQQVLTEGWRPESLAAGRMVVPRVKIIADGSIQGFTGYLTEPYYTPFEGDAEYRGYPSVSREDLFHQLEGLYRERVQAAIHCNGDASLDDTLDAIEAAQAVHPWPEARPLIIHAQLAREDQIARMADLGVTPSFFPSHTYYWGDRHAGIFVGPERATNLSPAQWALNHGVRFSGHQDTPVTPMLPMQIVWSQTQRQTRSGAVLGPEQRIDPVQALRSITIDAAWQVFMDDQIGSLEPGKLADLVVLSGNPLTEDDVRTLRVEATYIGGAEVWSRR